MVSESRSATRLPSQDTLDRRNEPSNRSRGSALALQPPVAVPHQVSECGILDRLATRGVPSLSDAELLALVLPSSAGIGTHDLARELLDSCGGVVGLLNCDFGISRAQGLNEQQAAAVLAAVELGRRLVSTPNRSAILADPEMAARYLHLRHARIDQEVVGALLFDVHQRVVGEVECFRGSLMRAVVEPKPILREALRRNASSILLFHNHPSGDPTPSKEDLSFTVRMKEACEALGLELVEHLILSGQRWTSLRRFKASLLSSI
jgi:DNA repair protein RadC